MTDVNTGTDDGLNEQHAEAQHKGAPAGVRNKDVSDGHSREGNPAPKIVNTPPVKEPTAEEKAAKEAADKVAADAAKTTSDAAPTAEELAKAKEVADALPKTGDYQVYGNDTIDSAISLLKEAKVPPLEAQAIFAKAIKSLDAKDIDIKVLTDKVGKEKATLIMAGMEKFISDYHATVGARTKAVYDTAGGKDTFETISKWAQAKEKTDAAFAGELQAYRTMIDTSPTAAKLATQELVKAYNADPLNKSLQVKMFQGDKPGNQESVKGLSRADYIKQLKVAEAKGDKTTANSLHAARMAGKRAGM